MQRKVAYTDVSVVFNRFQELYGEVNESQKQRYVDLFDKFKQTYNENSAYVASSSGRVEVCGNHTDHNGGRVVSCAISLDTLAMFLPTNDSVISILSDGYPKIIVDLNGERKEEIGTSSALVRGVCVGLENKGYNVGGFKAVFTSNVLGGAGISSSASFEVLIAEIENFLYNDGKIDNDEKSKIAQFSENVYFGKPCGLLDQTAIAYGGLKKLNFSDKDKIDVSEISCGLSDYTLVLINTGGSHADLTDEYASIPKEMKEVAALYGKERLIDVSEEDFIKGLSKIYNSVSDRAILRAFHFYEENERVDSLAEALNNGDYNVFLRCVKESGISSLNKLQNCFVAGTKEQLIPKALSVAAKFLNGGANRVHGGGFAGSILNIVKNTDLEVFIQALKGFYPEKDIIPLKVRSVGTIVL